MKILWLTNIPSPYRIDFFNELGQFCDLTVLFERNSSSERDDSWEKYNFYNFDGIIMKGINYGKDKGLNIEVINYLKHNLYDHIVVSNFSSLTGMLAIEYMRLKKISYFIESDGGFPKKLNKIKMKIKKHVISGAKGYFSTADIHDEYYLEYGATKELIRRYPFTSLRKEDICNEVLLKEEKENLKRELSIKEKKMILTITRSIPIKGTDVLLKAAVNLSKEVAVCIIGDEPTKEYLEIIQNLGLTNVYFLGYMNKNLLSKYYLAADLFVLPTRGDIWGLAINEAMASGLPIVTTNHCIAGLELVKNNENGYIVNVNDSKDLSNKINSIINDETAQERMSRKSLDFIRDYTIENMVTRHLEIFEYNGEEI